jgi:hypothetical protein
MSLCQFAIWLLSFAWFFTWVSAEIPQAYLSKESGASLISLRPVRILHFSNNGRSRQSITERRSPSKACD